ncbi:phage holin [Edwardsiella tarda]|uniref:phage holin n=1 Tax=Edwardsiella tarda TaxID=636 RepID=UPI00244473BE|nr:phage holin [Edwardsiella tarda]WGE29419.1 phage holin [Edwardsiella tarda]
MRIDQVTTHSAYSTSVIAGLAGFLDSFNSDEWAAIGVAAGIFFAALTWATNFYFQYKRNRILERQGHAEQENS